MKLHLITSKDQLRPVMCHIYVTRQNCVATNAHVLGVIPTDLVFDSQFIAEIPEEGFYIHPDDWKTMIQADYILWKSPDIIKLVFHKFSKRNQVFEAFKVSDIGRPIQWEQVMPDPKNYAPVSQFGVNASLLKDLQDALGFESVRLTFTPGVRAAMVQNTGAELRREYGIIMPIMLDHEKTY